MDDKSFAETLAQLDELQSVCTGCGLCNEVCATFQLTGWEHESPRGRLQLAAQFLHGHVQPSSPALATFDSCLSCQACEALCPHNVNYSQIREKVQHLRHELSPLIESQVERSQYKLWVTLARRIGKIWWRQYGWKWLQLPSPQCGKKPSSFVKHLPLSSLSRPTLAFCCLQDLWQHDVLEKALTFMDRLGYSVALDKRQPCCGAIFERLIHGGNEGRAYPDERQSAQKSQQLAQQAFLHWLPKTSYFLSQGCACFTAKHSSQKVKSLEEAILELLKQNQWTLRLPHPLIVYYQPYCQSLNEKDQIEKLLASIEGITLRHLPYTKACCGGYCGEALLHPQSARQMAEQKLNAIAEGSTVIVTSPDCWFQLQGLAAKKQIKLLYPIQLLAQTSIVSVLKNAQEPY